MAKGALLARRLAEWAAADEVAARAADPEICAFCLIGQAVVVDYCWACYYADMVRLNPPHKGS